VSTRTLALAAIAVLFIVGLGAAGYVVGKAEAPSQAEADQAREVAEEDARQLARVEAYQRGPDRADRRAVKLWETVQRARAAADSA
jgi:uncharacterized protein HemX